jgi:hypothetical protein
MIFKEKSIENVNHDHRFSEVDQELCYHIFMSFFFYTVGLGVFAQSRERPFLQHIRRLRRLRRPLEKKSSRRERN